MRRLGKQRVEAYQILRALTGESTGWRNHPATKMWRGHETALAEYGLTMCNEWARRGYVDNLASRFREYILRGGEYTVPEWIGDPEFHASHRSNLLRKAPEWYGQFGWTESDDIPYVWPLDKIGETV